MLKVARIAARAIIVLGPLALVGILVIGFVAKLGNVVPKIRPEDLTFFRVHNLILCAVLFHIVWMAGTISVLTNYWLTRKRLGLRYFVILKNNYHRSFEFAFIDALYLTYYFVKFHSFLG